MQDWLFYILIATFIYGIMNFIYKIAAQNNYNTPIVVMLSSATISIIGFIYLILTKKLFHLNKIQLKYILFYAGLNAISFGTANLSKIQALKKAPAALVLPINKLNSLFVMLIGIFFFKDTPNNFQKTGMLLSLIALYILTSKSKNQSKSDFNFLGISLALLAAILTSFSMTIGKLASTNPNVNKIVYVIFSYTLVFIYSMSLVKITLPLKKIKKILYDKKLLLIGFIIGLLNGVGYFIVLLAFNKGPISLIQGVFCNSILIPIILARIIYKEQLNLKRIIGIILSLIAISFIHIH